MDKILYTRTDLVRILENLGLQKGSIVLLQAADSQSLSALLGNTTTLIETILDIITPSGMLIVPSFTFDALDPACKLDQYPPEYWQTIRSEHPGFSNRTMLCDFNSWPANALLLHTKAKRTEHPVYSFTWQGGTVPYKPVMDTLDYPLSYNHVLSEMKKAKAVNLLVGVSLDDALYPLLQAREEGKDITFVQSALVRRVKKLFDETFLTSRLSIQTREEILKEFEIRSSSLDQLQLHSLILRRSEESISAAS